MLPGFASELEASAMGARYHFLSEYTLAGDRAAIWVALTAVRDWPAWWRWLRRIDVVREAKADDGVGAIYRNHVRAPTGYGFVYTTEIVGVDHLHWIDVLSSGDIVGRGRFLVTEGMAGEVDVSFAWLVETPKWWMNLLAPIARPAFTWNHDRLMTDFGRGLATASGAMLVRSRNTALRPGSPGFYEMVAVDARPG
jgi:hypothetical protein